MLKVTPAYDFLMARISPNPETGCWDWIGNMTRHGYGRGHVGGKGGRTYMAHRLSWELHRGEVPEGLELDHLCRNRACVNPDHLEPVSHRENVLRGVGPSAQLARQTHCKRGHELTEANIYRPPKTPNQRICRTCIRERNRLARPAYRARRRARLAAEKAAKE